MISIIKLVSVIYIFVCVPISQAQSSLNRRCEELFLDKPSVEKKLLIVDPTAWDKRELSKSGVTETSQTVVLSAGFFGHLDFYLAVFGRLEPWIERTVKKFEKEDFDGIVGVQDFPASLIASALGERLGLKVPKLQVMLSLHNKYLSRQIQRKAAPEAVPDFALVDLKSIDPKNPPLPYPFFLKPVKGLSSIKAQIIRGPEDFIQAAKLNWKEKALSQLVARPFDLLSAQVSRQGVKQPLSVLRSDFELVSNQLFIAEGLLKGDQYTVDGLVQNGEVKILGVVDSIMYPGTNSFESFQYPSRLSHSVQNRMAEIATKVMRESGFDSSLFNIEMFYDATCDSISIIEINPRMAYQFADLYEKVDGVNLYSLQAQIAAGEPIQIRRRQGAFRVAGSFVPRVFPGQKILHQPDKDSMKRLQNNDPSIRVRLINQELLPALGLFDDPQSQRLAFFNIGGDSFQSLRERINQIYDTYGPKISSPRADQ